MGGISSATTPKHQTKETPHVADETPIPNDTWHVAFSYATCFFHAQARSAIQVAAVGLNKLHLCGLIEAPSPQGDASA